MAVAQVSLENGSDEVRGLVGEKLTLAAFNQLAGYLGGIPCVKAVYDRELKSMHFMDSKAYRFHARYIAEQILSMPYREMEQAIDKFNWSFYQDPNRRFYLGLLSLHTIKGKIICVMETVEVDTMESDMIADFFAQMRKNVDPAVQLLFMPSHHGQEATLQKVDPAVVPRIFSQDLYSASSFIPLNVGSAKGRLRAFQTLEEYHQERNTLEWFDIIVMHKVPDDIPRLSGIINAERTTPLSHTNVLAVGWQIPNAVQLDVWEDIQQKNLNNQWVEYQVVPTERRILLQTISKPVEVSQRPVWSLSKIRIEEPATANIPIVPLEALRMSDRYKYGTKAANLGELNFVINEGSERLTGFYKVRRPPRENLLGYLAKHLHLTESVEQKVDLQTLNEASWKFIKKHVRIPRGIAIPFTFQQLFLESSSKIQQGIGKLKMALELNARQSDSLCISLQQMIKSARIPDEVRAAIDRNVATHLAGVSSFVVRSSSNAEDLENFSAAGIYESFNHITTADTLFESIKTVWASLLSPRSVRLRHEVGISLDDAYMGVIVQEEMNCQVGGVLVTTNPTIRSDFRHVYLNISANSVREIVQGVDQPFQYLYNTVEGGGRTLSIGNAKEDLPDHIKQELQALSLVGRLLQAHFSPDYTFNTPVDIEWLYNEEGLYILQLRPFAH